MTDLSEERLRLLAEGKAAGLIGEAGFVQAMAAELLRRRAEATDRAAVYMAAERLSVEAQSSSLTTEGRVLRNKMQEIAGDLFRATPEPKTVKAGKAVGR